MRTNPMFDTEDGFVSLPLVDVQALGFDQISVIFSLQPTTEEQRVYLKTKSLAPALTFFLRGRQKLRRQTDGGEQWFDLREALPLKSLYGFNKTNCSTLKLFVTSDSWDFPYLQAVWNVPRYSEAIAGPAVIDKSVARRIRKELKHTSKKSQSNLILKRMVKLLGESPTELLNGGLIASFDQLLGFVRTFLESVPVLTSCKIAVSVQSVEAMLDILMPTDVTSHGAVQSILQKSLHRVSDLSGFKVSGLAGNNSEEIRPLTTTFHDHLRPTKRSFTFKTYSKGSFDGTTHLRSEFKDNDEYRLGICKSGLEAATALKRTRSWRNISLLSNAFSERLRCKLETEDITPTLAFVERVLKEAGLPKLGIEILLCGNSLKVESTTNRALLQTCCNFRAVTSARLKPALLNLVFGELVGRERFEKNIKRPYKKPRILSEKPNQFNQALHLAKSRGIEHVNAKNMRSQNPPWGLGKSALSDFIKAFREWWMNSHGAST